MPSNLNTNLKKIDNRFEITDDKIPDLSCWNDYHITQLALTAETRHGNLTLKTFITGLETAKHSGERTQASFFLQKLKYNENVILLDNVLKRSKIIKCRNYKTHLAIKLFYS